MTTEDIFNEVMNAPDLDLLHPATFLAILQELFRFSMRSRRTISEDEDDLDERADPSH